MPTTASPAATVRREGPAATTRRKPSSTFPSARGPPSCEATSIGGRRNTWRSTSGRYAGAATRAHRVEGHARSLSTAHRRVVAPRYATARTEGERRLEHQEGLGLGVDPHRRLHLDRPTEKGRPLRHQQDPARRRDRALLEDFSDGAARSAACVDPEMARAASHASNAGRLEEVHRRIVRITSARQLRMGRGAARQGNSTHLSECGVAGLAAALGEAVRAGVHRS